MSAIGTKPLPEIGTEAEFMTALATGIRSVYQPIVRLSDRHVIGYEALARGPLGSPLERPDALFATAARQGLSTALDWECWRAALRGALQGGMNPQRALFVNVEPSSATSWVPEIGDPLLEEALQSFPLIVELTERALPNHTTDLIPLAEDLRRRGARIALDDVGTDPRSLALMPFLRPDVIKLDLNLMHDSPTREIAEVVHAVNAEAERTGALILAEGIETEDHLRRALALGASYGQGWLFGRPAEMCADREPVGSTFPLRDDLGAPPVERTPFEIVAAKRPTRRWPRTRRWSRRWGWGWAASRPPACAASTWRPTRRCATSGTSPCSAPTSAPPSSPATSATAAPTTSAASTSR
ncbi:MAG TPA: EAL domain-containing protein [Solirubrobacterales bacterium]